MNNNANVVPKVSLTIAQWIRSEASWVVMIFVASRLFVFGLILWSRMTIHHGRFWQPGGLLTVLTQYEGASYIALVKRGYVPTDPASVAYCLPVFPMFGKLLQTFTADPSLAVTLASNISLLGAGLLLNELVRTDFGELEVRRNAVSFLMFSPASTFLSNAYPESTFLMLSIGALLAAIRERWLVACLLGMATSATRFVGVLIVFPLLAEFVSQAFRGQRSFRAAIDRRFLFLALVPSGALLFMLYGYFRLHLPFLPLHDNLRIGPAITSPQNTAAYAVDYDPRYASLFIGFVVANVLLLSAGVWLKLRPAYLTNGFLLVLAFVCFAPLDATPRNFGVVFPLFIVLGVVATRLDWLSEGLLAISVGLLTLWTVLFANGQYVV